MKNKHKIFLDKGFPKGGGWSDVWEKFPNNDVFLRAYLKGLQSSRFINIDNGQKKDCVSNQNSRVLRIAKSGKGRVKARIRVFPKKGILNVK